MNIDSDPHGAADHRHAAEQPDHVGGTSAEGDVAARPGRLTPGWQVAVTLAWVAAIVALGGVWNASRQLGLSTWWLGPPADPRPIWVTLVPFVPPAVVGVLALTGRRYVPWAGLVAAACIAAVGVGDLDRITGLAVVELLIAAAVAMVSVAALSGTYRAANLQGDDHTDERTS